MTYYEILGVPRSATQDEIRTAYRVLARRYHPDSQGETTPEQRLEAEEAIKAINAAYQVLSDPRRRRAYHEVMWTPRDPARQFRFRSGRTPAPTHEQTTPRHQPPHARVPPHGAMAALQFEIAQTRQEMEELADRQEHRRRRLWMSAAFTSLAVYFLIAFGSRLFPTPAEILPLALFFFGGELVNLSVIMALSGIRLPGLPFAGHPVAFSATVTLGALVTCSAVPGIQTGAAATNLYTGTAISAALLLHIFLVTRLAKLQEALCAQEQRRLEFHLRELERRLQEMKSRKKRDS